MDKKSKILFSLFGILIVLSVSASYYRFIVLHDYIIEAQVDCDPSSERCFVWECDPSIEGECTGNPDEDTWYFKIAHRNAKNIIECDSDDKECLPFVCLEEKEESCSETLCTEETVATYSTYESCTNPDDFLVTEPEEITEGTSASSSDMNELELDKNDSTTDESNIE